MLSCSSVVAVGKGGEKVDFKNTLCLPPKFYIHHCFQMFLGAFSQEQLKTVTKGAFDWEI